MPTLCFITFNESPAGVYYGGQVLSGKVSLTTERIKAIRGIYITVRGYADVHWTENANRNSLHDRSEGYHAHDNYFDSRVDVLRSSDGNSFDLAPGKYEYNYQITLPPDLPSSFNGQYGMIRPLDLNLLAINLLPVERQDRKEFSRICCCGNGGEVSIKGSIPCGGFVPGQSIPVSIFIKNLSRVTSYETNACLVQTVDYRSYTPYQHSTSEARLVTINLFGPLEKRGETDHNCNLCIPAIPPSSLNSCNIIEVSYCVEIQFKTRGLHTNLTVKLPVTIGTIPYFTGYNQREESGTSFSQAAVASGDPPAYEEAIKLGPNYVTNREEDKYIQNVNFLPRYPVYSFQSSNGVQPNDRIDVVTSQPN
ncbi:unnamed protein product [Hermetia illucens]|uniref:Arrestin C-terminal-like domain-containing protein n=1 Tax=Hermetia illucens TaxID=343691 RepID=A0A7R8V5T2_HERIL|nr:unnamed protein product [Hermetia illucens]